MLESFLLKLQALMSATLLNLIVKSDRNRKLKSPKQLL